MLRPARYLKVTNFEDILHRSAGKHGLWAGRALQVVGILCTCIGWLRSTQFSDFDVRSISYLRLTPLISAIHPIWLTFIRPLSSSNFLASRWFVLIISSFFVSIDSSPSAWSLFLSAYPSQFTDATSAVPCQAPYRNLNTSRSLNSSPAHGRIYRHRSNGRNFGFGTVIAVCSGTATCAVRTLRHGEP